MLSLRIFPSPGLLTATIYIEHMSPLANQSVLTNLSEPDDYTPWFYTDTVQGTLLEDPAHKADPS